MDILLILSLPPQNKMPIKLPTKWSKKNTKWYRAREYYNSHDVPNKLSLASFYQNLKHTSVPEEEREQFMIRKQHHNQHSKSKIQCYKEEMEWFFKQPNPPIDRNVFRQRLKCWYSKEEAILSIEELRVISDKKRSEKIKARIANWKVPKPYKETRSSLQEEDPEDYLIRIKMKPEEYRIYRRVYQDMIDNIDEQLSSSEIEFDKQIIHKLEEKRKQLERELSVLDYYNK